MKNSGGNKGALFTLIVGLALNISLGVSKLVAGILSGSASVASDAANNLSDAAVSVVSIIAVAMSARAADHDHPYGHGRYEYIATFILGAVIAAVGIEAFMSGVQRAVDPVSVDFDFIVWITLGVSVAVKAFMFVFYRIRGKKSETLKAAAFDSLSDCVVTGVVLICAVAEKKTGVHIDGYASIAVSLVILVFAFRILRRVVNDLLGARPDPELVERIKAILGESELALSMHDLVINDYGEFNKIAEADIVFPSDLSFIAVHEECDRLERRVKLETGVTLSIHADPSSTDVRLAELCDGLAAAVLPFNATVHDVGIDDGKSVVRLDVALSDDAAPKTEIRDIIEAQVRAALPGFSCDISYDYM